jgi:hypothetical protein
MNDWPLSDSLSECNSSNDFLMLSSLSQDWSRQAFFSPRLKSHLCGMSAQNPPQFWGQLVAVDGGVPRRFNCSIAGCSERLLLKWSHVTFNS